MKACPGPHFRNFHKCCIDASMQVRYIAPVAETHACLDNAALRSAPSRCVAIRSLLRLPSRRAPTALGEDTFVMNTVYSVVWNVSKRTFVVASELAKKHSGTRKQARHVQHAGALAIGIAVILLSISAQPAYAENSGLQLCSPNGDGTSGPGISMGSASVTDPAGLTCVSGFAFSLNNRGTDTGAQGFNVSTARVSGYYDGLLELKGDAGISMLGTVRMNGNQITDMAAGALGEDSTDAVNGSQLFATNRSLASLGDRVSVAEGNIVTIQGDISTINNGLDTIGTELSGLGDRLTVNEGSINLLSTSVDNVDGRMSNVEGSISTLQTDITNVNNTLITSISDGAIGLVRQDAASLALTVAADKGGTALSIAGTDGARTLSGVGAGRVRADSDDAVNGSQLFATNTAVSQLDGRVTSVEASINNLGDQVDSGVLGLVKQDDVSRDIEVAKDRDGRLVDFTGSEGTRTLEGVSAGTVDGASRQAVNGAQLFATGHSFANALGGGATMNIDGTVSAPTYHVNGIAVNNVGDAIASLDGRANQASSDIAGLRQELNALGTGSMGTGADHTSRIEDIERNAQDLGGRVDELEASFAAGGMGDSGLIASNVTDREHQPAIASGEGALAVGSDSVASASNAVSIGNGSVADRADTVSIGTQGQERQLTNLAAGSEDTDAVNMGQLRQSVRYDQNNGVTDYSRVTLGQQGTPVTMSNVARGRVASDSTEAINGSQLYDWTLNRSNEFSNATLGHRIKEVEQAMHAGIATALAARQAPYVPGHVTYSVGAAGYKSEGAAGVSTRYTAESGRWSLEGGFSNNRDGTGLYVGLSGVLGD